MHFGGNVQDNFSSGISVPIYILFFGMIGGYLRFLYKSQKGWFLERAAYEIKRIHPEMENEKALTLAEVVYATVEEKDRTNMQVHLVKRIIFNNSMLDLSMIFLPPILAVATYFMLLQGGVNENEALPTFAVVSFAIGLISNEIVQKLASFASSAVNTKK